MTRLNPELRKQILEDMLGKSYEAYVNFKKEPLLPKKRQHRKRIPLWRFLLHLLHRDRLSSLIQWTAVDKFEFKIKEPTEVAYLWGSIKDKSDMTYEKLGRAMRYYYGKNIIEKVPGKRYSYRFIPSRKTTKYMENVVRKSSVDSSEDTEGSEASLDSIKDDFEMGQDAFDDPTLTDSPSSYLNDEYDSPKSSVSSDADICVNQEDLSDIYSHQIFSDCYSFQAEIEMLHYDDEQVDLLKRTTDQPLWTLPIDSIDDDVGLIKNTDDNFLLDLTAFNDFEAQAARLLPITDI